MLHEIEKYIRMDHVLGLRLGDANNLGSNTCRCTMQFRSDLQEEWPKHVYPK